MEFPMINIEYYRLKSVSLHKKYHGNSKLSHGAIPNLQCNVNIFPLAFNVVCV